MTAFHTATVPTRRDRRPPAWPRWCALLILLAGLAVYANSLEAAFVFDDHPSVVNNATIRKLWPPWGWLAPPDNIASRPLLNLTLAINYAVSGEAVWSYHVFNLGVHLAAGLLMFGILRRTLSRYAPFRENGHRVALAATLVWVVHPLNTQAVTYVVQRGESLMGLCAFLTLYCAVRGWEADRPAKWHLSAVAACTAGMGVKEAMAVAPFLVLGYDCLYHRRSPAGAVGRSRLLYGGLLFSLAALAAMVGAYGSARLGREDLPFTWLQYLATQPGVICHYFKLAVWPAGLTLLYNWPLGSLGDALPCMLPLAGALALALWAYAGGHPAGYPAVWVFATLAPTSSVIPIRHPIFEHRMYLPLAGLCVLAVVGGHALVRNRRAGRTAGAAVLLTAVVALGAGTVLRNADYASPVSLWQATYERQQSRRGASSELENAVGYALLEAGRYGEAMPYFHRSIRIDPANAVAHNNMGSVYFRWKQYDAALACFRKAARLRPRLALAHLNIGAVLAQRGETTAAIPHFRRALALNPHYFVALYNLGMVYAKKEMAAEAIDRFQAALELKPDHPGARLELAAALSAAGRYREALGQLESLSRQSPRFPGAYRELGRILLAMGLDDEAARAFRRELNHRPGDPEAYNGLAVAAAKAGDLPAAVAYLEKALESDPQHAAVRRNLARLRNDPRTENPGAAGEGSGGGGARP